ncbi:calcium-binding protein, partial [bacterium]|nr:calcium-binding protein [bacterium]
LPRDPERIFSIDPDIGGDDTIDARGGENTVIGGYGNDTILAGADSDTVIGDNGAVENSSSVATATSTTLTGAVVVGDTWQITVVVDGLATTFSYIAAATDTLADVVAGLAASINAVSADDYLAVGNGDTLLLINQTGATFTATTMVLPVAAPAAPIVVASQTASLLATSYSLIQTTDPTLGGDDVIQAGDGDNVALGGFGSDAITTGSGTDVVLGDNGILTYTPDAGGTAVLTGAQTTDVTGATGGSDVIVGGGGTEGDVILAGVGADTVTTVAATTSTQLTGTVAVGDTWTVELAAGGVATSFSYVVAGGETLADIVAGLAAAINTLTTDAYQAIAQGETLVVLDASGTVFTATYTLVPAAGPTVVVATVTAVAAGSGGNDVVIGDNGYATWDTTGLLTTFGSTQQPYDPLVVDLGGDDVVYAGDGNNVVVGGYGNDTITTGADNDIVIGDNGQFDATSGSTTLIATTDTTNLTGGNDVIDVGDG